MERKDKIKKRVQWVREGCHVTMPESVPFHLISLIPQPPSEWSTVVHSGRMAERPTGPLPRQGFGKEYGVQWTPRKRV